MLPSFPTRRAFTAGALASLIAPRGGAATTPDRFRASLEGPICSVPTVYREDLRIDGAGFSRIVECGLRAGASAIALTAGNSQYDRLTFDEVKELTRILVKSTAGKALTIAATGPWWTGQAEEYARFAASTGADAVQVMLPPFGDEDLLFEHYRRIAAASHLPIVLHGQVPLPLLKRLMELDQVAAYKEEYPPNYSVEVFSLYGKKLNIFAGGQKSRYMMFQPFGMKAYYSTFATFAPEIPKRFWSACRRGDTAAAREIVYRYDVPFFAKWSHPFWRATLELFGVAGRFVRPPDRTFTSEQVKALKSFYSGLGIAV